jgi:hypothetical protein
MGAFFCVAALVTVVAAEETGSNNPNGVSRESHDALRGAAANLSGASGAREEGRETGDFGGGLSMTSSTDYQFKFAYGKTFGTSTALDYTTVELNRRITAGETEGFYGPARGEFRLALLASRVNYHAGDIERVKRLEFQDGLEMAVLPKARISFLEGLAGFLPYMESGAGMSYVTETYRNSGSRWNWSLLGGMGMERRLVGKAAVSLGLQWRHLSNGNMWGKGDELHNSNSGTDMVQAVAALLHQF